VFRQKARGVAWASNTQSGDHLLFGSQAAETTTVTIARIPWIRTARGANTTVVNRYATLAAVCVLIPFGTAPLASADPPPDPSVQSAASPAPPVAPSPDNGAVPSGPPGVLDAPDGCLLTVVGSDESEDPVPPLTTAITSREYDASGTFTGTVTCQ
jgi:hypothetical protein